ncbi:MAG: dihydroorotate dehydrogenase electron transfer subunit [Candidatus Omnitrophota bacterium]|nr:dihydroorotate dehydrogenase electron transfer subunit [Candidatus Omnitrophota bacterium]
MTSARQFHIPVLSLTKIKPTIYIIRVRSRALARRCRPGQFLHIKVDTQITLLRRPLSIHAIEHDTLSLLFRVRGRGTELLSRYKKGDMLDIIGPLGNGFNTSPRSSAQASPKETVHGPQRNILVAGGIGVAPLVFLAQKLAAAEQKKSKGKGLVLLGAKNKHEVLGEHEFKKVGFEVLVATDDGSRGFRGTVTDLLEKQLSAHELMSSSAHIYACGPQEMFKRIRDIIAPYPSVRCQVSFEQFMGCGLGICCGCVIQASGGYKKVCKDGPVFNIKEIYA